MVDCRIWVLAKNGLIIERQSVEVIQPEYICAMMVISSISGKLVEDPLAQRDGGYAGLIRYCRQELIRSPSGVHTETKPRLFAELSGPDPSDTSLLCSGRPRELA